ncbi:MAG: hypothetical protein IMY72_03840 [Bacteroidetes bacterium]|nr:hypothetical protein [Bacteroidota bacterium]
MMKFDNDIFISLSEEDISSDKNNLLVNNICHYLPLILEQSSNKKPNILNSSELNKSKKDKLDIFSKTLLFVIVLTENYLKTEKCINELDLILETLKQQSLRQENRIFKIIDSKKTIENQPKLLQHFINYRFFELDKEAGRIIDFNSLQGNFLEKALWLKLIDLTYDIQNSIIMEKNQDIELLDARKTIYLSKSSSDQLENYNRLKREFLHHKLNVIPRSYLSSDPEKLKPEILNNLKHSLLSIHIIGGDYGDLLDNSEESIMTLQNKIAAKFYEEISSENPHFSRIIWMPQKIEFKSKKQELYVNQLIQNINAVKGAEIVQTPIEVLKQIVLTKTEQINTQNNNDLIEEKANDDIRIYIINDKKDEDKVDDIIKYFENNNIKILASSYTGKQIDILNKHRENLVKCDAVFIYSNNNLQWIKSKIKDIKKSPGFGRDKAFMAKVFYSDIECNDSTLFDDDFVIFDKQKQFNPDRLSSVLTKLKKQNG